MCELKKSQITSGSVQTLLENSLFWFRTIAAPRPEEKCWFITKTNVGKINPMCPLCYVHAGILLKKKPGCWSLTRCWATEGVLSLGRRYCIDTSDVFLIHNHTAITKQLCNHHGGFFLSVRSVKVDCTLKQTFSFINVIEVKMAQGLQKHSPRANILGAYARPSSLI